MESNENKKEKECCSDKDSCSTKSSYCCCGKIFIAFILLLIGGAIGYLSGKNCSYRYTKMQCAMTKQEAAQSAPAPVAEPTAATPKK